MKYVIYDFNGTILDDLDLAILCQNKTIEHFNLKRKPIDKEEYLKIFTFPVKDYYERVGYDWNEYPFKEVGRYWMDQYIANKDMTKLHDGVIEILKKNHENGNKNILLSASFKSDLLKQLEELGIVDYFDEILGLSDIYAGSKVDVGLNFIKDKNPDDCLMIGDSLHDKEVADAMGVKCYLVAKGHQGKDVLLKETDLVCDDISEVPLW